ncbi:MAG TPA: ATP-binding protein [Pyrinomonadaceae bacterium]|nr:ATP-binding protein [Pyrinomonadaceae bacterium]
MRSLFLKVFLWFWLATYARHAVAAYEREGPAALDACLRHAEGESGIGAKLLDATGRELTGARETTAREREAAVRVAQTGGPVFGPLGPRMLEVRRASSEGGARYAFVVSMPMGRGGPPRGPFGFLRSENASALAVRLLAVVLTAGVLCYLLARYIVSPVVKLRAVTRQVTQGDLSARVGPLLGKRRDELGAMGRDFDAMAAQIETLLSAQQRLLRDISHELRSPLARLRVALDVVRNAVRHTPEGTTVRVSLRCRREGDGSAAVISVRDAGPGVPEEMLSDIFRPFFRVDDSRTRETGGAGLGLAIAERAVRLHGGEVRATNPPGGGLLVELRLNSRG